MRRFARRLFTLCSAASLLLCVAVCVLWARSFHAADPFGWEYADDERGSRLVGVISSRGAVALSWARVFDDGDNATGPYWNPVEPLPLSFTPGWRTFEVERYADAHETVRGVILPHWLLAAVAVVGPVVWLMGWATKRTRTRGGRCPACGYDLRATAGRCPECGTAASPAAPPG